SNAPEISYVAGHMLLGAEIDGTFVFHLGDALSSVRDVVDDTGAVIKSFEFDEYGNLLNATGSGPASPKTWIGGLSVNDDRADSGMFNMGHRNYAAGVLGRFISRDPIGHAGDLNLYSYPTNPVQFTDSSGLNPTAIAIGAGVVAFYVYKGYGEPWIAGQSPPTDQEIASSLQAVPPEVQAQFKEILDYYREIYADNTSTFCHYAADGVRGSLEKKFRGKPGFENFRFNQDRTWHSYLRAPTNYATVTCNRGTPKDESDDVTLYLYAGSDRIYRGISVPRVSPRKVEPGEWTFEKWPPPPPGVNPLPPTGGNPRTRLE
ncbi:MAG: RHS repeat-associated core domain-containing protein, partial [Candidatus Eremiobacteraeota bacterium]|nr:RHS repeat-associated core domain-containing protein [Candidatus Eremiobacteraeota bacterium]